uniref:C2H2-type domain-containing protein n=1 Tax=Cacopsylla melanoneura TaxID=428564 RepID=A0A8D8V212_9HEMI
MEVCSEIKSVLVNNNDVKGMHNGEKEEEHAAETRENSTNERKAIGLKKESSTDEESDVNCSIVKDQTTDTSDSIKITFKLKKKDKSERKKKHSLNNDSEKVGSLIINTHGEYSIKNKGHIMSDTDSMPEQNKQLAGNNEETCENAEEDQVLDSSDLNIDSSELAKTLPDNSGTNDNKQDVCNENNTSKSCDEYSDTESSACPSATKPKRKPDPAIHGPSTSIPSKTDIKTETEDCTKEITPRTKRRKLSKTQGESSEPDVSTVRESDALNRSEELTKNSLVSDKTMSEGPTFKRELDTSADDIEPKPKKIKKESCENIPVPEDSDSSLENKNEVGTMSSLEIEIPEDKTRNAKQNSDEKSPTQKSPRDAKKITLQEFLNELNEESKNIKEGDEIPDDEDDDQMSTSTGSIAKEDEKKEQDDENNTNKLSNAIEEEKSDELQEIVSEPEPESSEPHSTRNKVDEVDKTKSDAERKDISPERNEIDKIGAENNISQKCTIEKVIKEDQMRKLEDEFSDFSDDEIPESDVNSDKKVNEKNQDTDEEMKVGKSDEPISDKEKKSGPVNKTEKKSGGKSKSKEKTDNAINNVSTGSESQSDSTKEKSRPSDELDNISSADSSESSESSDDSSSSGSDSSDSDSSSDSETGSDSSDSDSTDAEKKKPIVPTVTHPKKLKIRNAPSLSQDSVHKSDSSLSNQDLEKPLKLEDKVDTPNILAKPLESLSKQILSGNQGVTPVVKKKRGRPRKYPRPEDLVVSETSEIEIKSDVPDDIVPDNTVVSIVNTGEEQPKIPKKRGRKPGFKLPKKRGRKPARRKVGRPRKKYYEEYKKQKEEEAAMAYSEKQTNLKQKNHVEQLSVLPVTPVVKRPRGRPKKIRDPEPSTSEVNVSNTYLPSDALSEQLLQLNSQLNLMVNNIPADDQNSNEITDNRLLEEINSGLDVITEEIVSEDVSNYLGHPLDDILQFQEPKKEIKVEFDDDYDNMNNYKPEVPRKNGKARKSLKTEDPNYHKKYYKYVKIPKDQQKKRGPKKRVTVDVKPERKKRIPKTGPRRPTRPRKRDLGAIDRREEKQTSDEDCDHPWDESLSKELESVNRSMENILDDNDYADDKDFTVAHLKFEQLSEDQLKRSNRPKKSDHGMFSDFDNQIDELIEMTANEAPKPKYRYYERIPKHLQKKRGRPRKNPDETPSPRPPKPKKEKPPKPKKTVLVKKMVTDPETGEEKEIEVEEEVTDEEEYIDFDEEDEYDEDIDDEDKDKDFDIGDYLKKEKNGINEKLEYEEVYPTKEKLFKPKKTLKNYKSLKTQHHARFNRFGKFGNKIRNMMPARRSVNACDFRYVTVCDADYNPIAKVQRMYCVKVAPATYDVAERYKPRVKVRNLDDDDVNDFFDKYWCDQCEISFIETRINKRRHDYIFHTEEIECDLCDRTVSNRFNLRKHKEIFHQKKVYQCKICEEEHKKFRTFQMHVWEAHPDVRGSNRAYFCNICQTVFYRRASFKFHYHEHLNGNIFAQFNTSLSDIEFLLKQLMY